MKPNVIIRTMALAAAIVAMAACQTELETMTTGQELEIIIPETKTAWQQEDGTTTRVTEPDADGRQQWQQGDVLDIKFEFNDLSSSQIAITATRNAAGGWDFSESVKMPLETNRIEVDAYHYGKPVGGQFYNDDILYSRTAVNCAPNKPATAAISLNNFDHLTSRLRITGLKSGDKVWMNKGRCLKATYLGASPAYDHYDATDYVQADNNGVATFYPFISVDLGPLKFEEPKLAITPATATSPAGATWHDFNVGTPDPDGKFYYNRTYTLVNPGAEAGTGCGYTDEYEWVKIQMFELGYTYVVQNLNDLLYLAEQVNAGNAELRNAKVIQMVDLNMSGKAISIGTDERPFAGLYYGNDRTVKGLTRAMFGTVNGAVLTNISVQGNLNYSGTNKKGMLANYVINSTVSMCSAAGSATGSGRYFGGLIGHAQASTIDRCQSSCNITLTGYGEQVGGLIGYLNKDSHLIASKSTGLVTGSRYAGGLVGMNGGAISFCYAKDATVKGYATSTTDTPIIGGLVGIVEKTSSGVGWIYNSYAAMTVDPTGTAYAGLLVGEIPDARLAKNSYGVIVNNSTLAGAGLCPPTQKGLIPVGNNPGTTVRTNDHTPIIKTTRIVHDDGLFPVKIVNYEFNALNVWTSSHYPEINTTLNPASIQP